MAPQIQGIRHSEAKAARNSELRSSGRAWQTQCIFFEGVPVISERGLILEGGKAETEEVSADFW